MNDHWCEIAPLIGAFETGFRRTGFNFIDELGYVAETELRVNYPPREKKNATALESATRFEDRAWRNCSRKSYRASERARLGGTV